MTTSHIKGPSGGTRAFKTPDAPGNNQNNPTPTTPNLDPGKKNLDPGKKPDSFERAQNQPPVLVAGVGGTQQGFPGSGAFTKKELLDAIRLLEKLSGSGPKLNVAGVEIFNTKRDLHITPQELEDGYKLLAQDAPQALQELENMWEEVKQPDDDETAKTAYIEHMRKAADFLHSHRDKIAKLDGDSIMLRRIGPGDIFTMEEKGLLSGGRNF